MMSLLPHPVVDTRQVPCVAPNREEPQDAAGKGKWGAADVQSPLRASAALHTNAEGKQDVMARFIKLHRVSDAQPVLIDVERIEIIVPDVPTGTTELKYPGDEVATVNESVEQIWRMVQPWRKI